MTRQINSEFLERAEGRRLKGYVPRARDGSPLGRSGVTIATGADIGQWSVEEIERLILPRDLKIKLRPYAGIRGDRAVKMLEERPLFISDREASLIDSAIHSKIVNDLARRFKLASGAEFDDLSGPVQTVLASLAINFGPGQLATMAKTWSFISSQDWRGLADWLDVFPSKQPELSARRRREAKLLRTALA
jgi:hypothetical protein